MRPQHLALVVPPPATEPPPPQRTDRKFGFGNERLEGNVAVLPIFGFAPLDSEPAQQQLAWPHLLEPHGFGWARANRSPTRPSARSPSGASRR